LVVVNCANVDESNTQKSEITDFRVNECGSGQPSSQLVSAKNAEVFAGLQCVSWALTNESIAIDMVGFPSPCGFGGFEAETLWRATTVASKSGLRLDLSWDFDGPSACGSCLDNFSFAIEPVEFSGDIDLTVSSKGCTSAACERSEETIALPLELKRSGTTCKYVDWNRVLARSLGGLHMPPDSGACNAGLKVALRGGQELCVSTCATDGNCPGPQGLFECKRGACALKDDSW
jgi:hypothetical protein